MVQHKRQEQSAAAAHSITSVQGQSQGQPEAAPFPPQSVEGGGQAQSQEPGVVGGHTNPQPSAPEQQQLLRRHLQQKSLPAALGLVAAATSSVLHLPEKAERAQGAPAMAVCHVNAANIGKTCPDGAAAGMDPTCGSSSADWGNKAGNVQPGPPSSSASQTVLPPLRHPLEWQRGRRAPPLLHTAARAAERASKMQLVPALPAPTGDSWQQQHQQQAWPAWQQQPCWWQHWQYQQPVPQPTAQWGPLEVVQQCPGGSNSEWNFAMESVWV